MTATDELRRLLDERGVEWWAEDDHEDPVYYFVTKWFANGCEQAYEEIPAIRSKSLNAYCVTPEQAVEATLGRGTCRFEWTLARNGWADHTCSACGYRENTDIHVSLGWSYCPNCGRKVVDE